MDDDIDIYEDLPSFEVKDEEKYKTEIKELSEKCNNYQQENTELKLKIDELLKNNRVLSNNLSSLLKTAKTEIARKDKMITELRQQNDNMAFRRKGYTKPKPAKPSTKPTQDNKYIPVVTPILYQTTNFEIDDTEQIYEPEKIANTVFGERLRKKILLEEELERAQKEQAKLAALENKVASVRAEEETIKENKTESNIVVKGSQEISNSFTDGDVVSGKASTISSSSDSLPSYKENDRNLCKPPDLSKKLLSKRKNDDVVCPVQNKQRIEDETYHHSDDMRYHNGNGKHESRFNLLKNDNCPSRDIVKHLHHRRGSNNCEESERKREFHGERSKSNHRSRSKSPPQDRRFVEKRADRHRTDRYRAYMDKYEKRRRSRDNRGNDYGNKFSKDLREKIEHRVELKVGGRSDYNNYKNSKFDKNNRRGSRESPRPFAKSRTSSRGSVKDKVDDKIQAKLSKSSDRLVGANDSHGMDKERRAMKTISKNRKLEKSPITSAEKEVKNKQITVTPLLDGLTSLIKSNENEIKRTSRKSKEFMVAKRKDRDSEPKYQTTSGTSSEKEVMNKPIASSTLLSKKTVSNKQHVPITSFLDDSASLRESVAISQDLKDQRKGAKRKSKEFTDGEKNHDSESKSQALLETKFEKELTKEQLTSTTPLPDNLVSLPESNAVSEDLKKHRKGERRKSKELTIGEEGDKQHVSSELLPNDSEKDVANKEGGDALASLPDGLASLPESNEMPGDLPKQLKDAKGNSMESTVAEVEKCDSELKCQTRIRTNSEKDASEKQHVPSVVMIDVSEKEVVSTTPLVEGLAMLPESNAVPEDLKKEHKSAKRKSMELMVTVLEDRDSKPKSLALTDTSSETEATTEQRVTSELLANDSEKKMENKQHASTAALPDGLVSVTESDEISEHLHKQCKSAREKPKETTVAEEKEDNSKPKSQTQSRTCSERDVPNNQLVSLDPLSGNSEKKSLSDGSALLLESDAKLKKQRKGAARRKSKEATVGEEKDCDSEPKFQTRSRTSSEEEVTNKELASSALLQLASSTLLPDNSNLLTESGEVRENLKKHQKCARRKSKNSKTTVVNENNQDSKPKSPTPSSTSSEKKLRNKQLDSSTLSVDGSKEEIMNNQHSSSTSLSDSLTSLSESDLVSEDLKKQRKDARRKSKDPKRRIAKEKDQNSEPKSQTPLRASSEKEVNNKEHASCVAVAKVLALKSQAKEILNIRKDLNSEGRKSSTATLQNVANQLDSPGKWISSVLENDTEIPPLPSEILPPNDIGSRSFREEKIENIEKFIQNYQDDEHLYCQIVKGDTAEIDSETISCISNTSILDTLSMDTEVDKPENGMLENSLMSEHLLLESLSTPVKKTNPPLPSIPPLGTMKQPPLPSIPHPDEKEQDLPQLPCSEEKKENLQPFSTSDENTGSLPKQEPKVPSPDIKHQTLSTVSTPDKKQQSSMLFPDTRHQALPPLPSSDTTHQALPPLPFSGTTNQALPLISSSDTTNETFSPLPPSETTNQPLPPLPSSDTGEQPPSLSSDIKNSDSKTEDFLPHPPADTKKQPSPLLATSDKIQQSPPPSPDNKNKAMLLLPSSVTKEQRFLPLPSSDTKEQRFPPLPSSDTKEQPLPPLPSSNTKKEPLPPLPSSGSEGQLLPPLPSSHTKEELLPPLPPSDTKDEPLPPLPSSDMKEELLPPLPPSDTKDEPVPLLPSSDKKEQPLPSLSPPPSVEKSLSPRLPLDTNKQQSSLCTDEKAPPLSSPVQKKDLPATPEEKSNPSSQLTPDEKQDLPLLPITHLEDKTKLFITAELASEEEKTSLAPISVPENETKLILWSLLASTKKKDHTTQLPASSEKVDTSQSPVLNEKRDSLSKPRTSLKENGPITQVPISSREKDSSSQITGSTEKKDSSSQLPTSNEKKDISSQLSASSKKKDSLPQLTASSEKKDSLYPLTASSEKKNSLSQLPAPTDKNHETSVTQNMFTSNSESEKTRAQKIAIKQIRRHKTSCTPIVSRYSRKRRDLVLTDFQPSRCIIIKPDSACDTQTNENPKVVIKTSPILTKEAKIILKPIESPNFYESTSKKCNNNGETKIERPEKLFKAANNITADNVKKIESKIPNGVPEFRKTDKIDSLSEVVPSLLPAEENPNSEKALEINEEESQPQIEFKEEAALPKMQNQESSSENKQPICVKPIESREQRSVLKTIAPPDSGGDVINALSSRKRCLPKEKENESKQVSKQCKIMVIARRRRPMHLEDCSTATTLVSSAQDTNCDQSSKKNNVMDTSLNSEKSELVQPVAEPPSKRRKRRSAEN